MADNIGDLYATLNFDMTRAERQADAFLRRIGNRKINFQVNALPFGRITKDVTEFEKSLGAANTRVVAFGASAVVLGTISASFRKLIVDAVNVEKALLDINVVLQANSSDLKKFSGELFNIAKLTGQSFAVVAEAAKELSRQGLGIAETQKRAQDALILTRQSGLDAADSVRALTVAINTFNKEGITSRDVINRLANVDANFAVSSKDLADSLSRVGSSAQDAGVSFNQLLGITTALAQNTGRTGAVIGNALKSIFTRTQRSDTLNELENIGIAVRDLQGKVLPAIQILQNLANVQDNLSDSQRSFISELVGGVFQINQLKTALNDLAKTNGTYAQAVKVAGQTTDEAIRRNAQLNQSISALANAAQQNLTKIASSLGEDIFGPAAKRILGGFNKIVEESDAEGAGLNFGKAFAAGLGNFFSSPGLAIGFVLLTKLTAQFIKFAGEASRSVLSVGEGFGRVGDIQRNLVALSERNNVVNRALLDTTLSREAREIAITREIQRQVAGTLALKSAAADVAKNIYVAGRYAPTTSGNFKNKAAGNIPVQSVVAEVAGARKAGYNIAPSNVRSMRATIQGRPTTVVYNNKEKVIHNFAGTGEPAIIPPTGKVTNYGAGGYVPNFNLFGFKKLAAQNLPYDIPEEEIKQIYKQYATAYMGFGKGKSTGGKLPVGLNLFANRAVNENTFHKEGSSYILGRHVDDIFVPQYFAPSSLKEGYKSIKSLAAHDNVAALVTENLVAQLEKAGFSTLKKGLQIPFRGEMTTKDLLVSSLIKTPLLASKLIPQLLGGGAGLKEKFQGKRLDGKTRSVYFGEEGRSHNVANLLKSMGISAAGGMVPNFAGLTFADLKDYESHKVLADKTGYRGSISDLLYYANAQGGAPGSYLADSVQKRTGGKKLIEYLIQNLDTSKQKTKLSDIRNKFKELGNAFGTSPLQQFKSFRSVYKDYPNPGRSFIDGIFGRSDSGRINKERQRELNIELVQRLRTARRGSPTGIDLRTPNAVSNLSKLFKDETNISSNTALRRAYQNIGKSAISDNTLATQHHLLVQDLKERATNRGLPPIYAQTLASKLDDERAKINNKRVRRNDLKSKPSFPAGSFAELYGSTPVLGDTTDYSKVAPGSLAFYNNLLGQIKHPTSGGALATKLQDKDLSNKSASGHGQFGPYMTYFVNDATKDFPYTNSNKFGSSKLGNSKVATFVAERIRKLDEGIRGKRKTRKASQLGTLPDFITQPGIYGKINSELKGIVKDKNITSLIRSKEYPSDSPYTSGYQDAIYYDTDKTADKRQYPFLGQLRNFDGYNHPVNVSSKVDKYNNAIYSVLQKKDQKLVKIRAARAGNKSGPKTTTDFQSYLRESLGASKAKRSLKRGLFGPAGEPLTKPSSYTPRRSLDTVNLYLPKSKAQERILGLGKQFDTSTTDASLLFRGDSREAFGVLRELGAFTSLGINNDDRQLGTNLTSSFLKAAGYALTLGRKGAQSIPGLIGAYGAPKIRRRGDFIKSSFGNESDNTIKAGKLLSSDLSLISTLR